VAQETLSTLAESVGLGLAVAASLAGGAAVAAVVRLPERAAAGVTAFGGGVLLAAVAVELVPEADERAGPATTAVCLLAGTVVYVAVDAWLTRGAQEGEMRRAAHAAAAGMPMTMSAADAEAARGEAIAAGIFVDGVPESVALGLTVAEGSVGLALLAGVLIGNVVEAYGAAQPLAIARSRRFALGLVSGIGLALAVATVLGATALADAPDGLIGAAEALAAGAVLAVIAVSVIPYAFSRVRWWVALASTGGFIVGYLLS
jgi:zinc transporter, ZIP family